MKTKFLTMASLCLVALVYAPAGFADELGACRLTTYNAGVPDPLVGVTVTYETGAGPKEASFADPQQLYAYLNRMNGIACNVNWENARQLINQMTASSFVDTNNSIMASLNADLYNSHHVGNPPPPPPAPPAPVPPHAPTTFEKVRDVGGGCAMGTIILGVPTMMLSIETSLWPTLTAVGIGYTAGGAGGLVVVGNQSDQYQAYVRSEGNAAGSQASSSAASGTDLSDTSAHALY